VTPRSRAQQRVDGAGRDFREKLPLRIRPLILGAAGDEHAPRRTERDQHVRVDRHIVPAADPLLKTPAEPVRKVLRHVVDRLTEVAA